MKIQPLIPVQQSPKFSGFWSFNKTIAKTIDENRLVDSFVSMVRMDTTSDSVSALKKQPSTDNQKVFAQWLKEILIKLGVEDVEIDEFSFLTGKIPANTKKNSAKIALMAHMDTKSPGKNIIPQIHKYNGGDLMLPNGIALSHKNLKGYENNTIITSSGKTVLGADDKAGIAEILEAIHIYKSNPKIKHPEIRLAFTPDEEVTGLDYANNLNLKKFDVDAGYTVDGNSPDIVDLEYCPAKSFIKKLCELYKNRFSPDEEVISMLDKKQKELSEKIRIYTKEGLEKSFLIPKFTTPRGYTDGTTLAMKGIPMANLGTGGHLGHTVYEYAVVEEMKKAVENIINVLSVWGEKG